MEAERLPERREDAVSPVIGVILMVAITVILAAVIGTFVLGIGEGVSENPRAGVTFDEDEGRNLSITVVSPGNIDAMIVRADAATEVSSDGLGTGEVVQSSDPRVDPGFFTSDVDDNAVRLREPRAGDRITIVACGQSSPPVIRDRVTVVGEVGEDRATVSTYEVSEPVADQSFC